MKKIGITGGIGSGKSMLTNWLREKGYPVIDADEVSREAAAPGEPAMLRLLEEIGSEVFNNDGSLNRQKLANIIFYDPISLMTVNEIFHGDIKERIEEKVSEHEKMGERVVFLSVPLLFETEADWLLDEKWLVTSDEEKRLKRVMDRDGITEQDVRARMASQMPEEKKRAKADFIIENNGTPDDLYGEVEKILKRI